ARWMPPGAMRPTPPRRKARGFVTATTRGLKAGQGLIGSHVAATASNHCAAASALKIRSVDREMRWRWWLNVLWTAACMLRKRWADAADLNRCILRSRRRTTWWEFSARLFLRSPWSWTTGQMEFSERGTVGPQFVGHDQPGREAVLSEQLAHSAARLSRRR